MWDTPTAPRGDPNGRHASKPRKEKNNIETKTNSNDMKRIPATLLWASSLLLLLPAASCTDTLGGDPDTDARAITFTPAAETRAAVGTDFPDGSSFSVWGWYGTDDPITNNVFDGETVTKSGGAWTYGGGNRYWIAGMTYNFYGVYPVYPQTSNDNGTTATVDDTGKITVTNFDCSKTGEEAVDLMTATDTRTLSNPIEDNETSAVTMKFQHELARVKFQTKTQGNKVTITSFKINGVSYKGDFSHQLPSGNAQWTIKQSTVAGDGIFSTNKTIENTTDERITDLLGDLLILPQQLETSKQQLAISYRYDDETTDRTKNVDLRIENGTTDWTAGQSYAYTLDLRTASLTLTVTIQDWTTQDADVDWKPSKP